ncbi:MAG TPA: amidohydrolase, partial [Gemmatimonadales bacterium]|nr:amidohydrolase [Gemmatimonadales bacterium]
GEIRTAERIATRLRALGLEVRTGVGGHGVVAILRGARTGPLVAFRADMDAVPSATDDPVEFRSVVPGIRHICGHDVHATIGVALAEGFAAMRERLAGSVMLVFQPAEEAATGARAMLADGVFRDGTPVAIYAVHTAPLEVGTLGTAPGPLMPGRDDVRVRISGNGDLAAIADSARRIIEDAGTVAPSEVFTSTAAEFVHVGRVGSRSAGPAVREVSATLSIASPRARRATRDALMQRLKALRSPDVSVTVHYDAARIAGVTNDSALVARANAAIATSLGRDAVRPITRIVPAFSEDFGSFQAAVPGVMYFLGVSNAKAGTRGMPHAPDYVADEGAILVGARAMMAVMLDAMGSPPGRTPPPVR